MTIIIVIACIIASLVGMVAIAVEINSRKTMGISSRTAAKLSWPARETMKAYRRVPVGSRPEVDIIKVLMALDKKHGGMDKVDHHFSRVRGYDGARYYGWNEATGTTRRDYEDIHDGLTDITSAIAEQEHQFAMAGISSQLDTARSLSDRMRDEANTIREITAKVKEDMAS